MLTGNRKHNGTLEQGKGVEGTCPIRIKLSGLWRIKCQQPLIGVEMLFAWIETTSSLQNVLKPLQNGRKITQSTHASQQHATATTCSCLQQSHAVATPIRPCCLIGSVGRRCQGGIPSRLQVRCSCTWRHHLPPQVPIGSSKSAISHRTGPCGICLTDGSVPAIWRLVPLTAAHMSLQCAHLRPVTQAWAAHPFRDHDLTHSASVRSGTPLAPGGDR